MIKKENFTFEDFIRFNGMVLALEICAGLQAINILFFSALAVKYILISCLCLYFKIKKDFDIVSVLYLYGYSAVINSIFYAGVTTVVLNLSVLKSALVFGLLCVLIAIIIKINFITYRRRREAEKKNYFKYFWCSIGIGAVLVGIGRIINFYVIIKSGNTKQILLPLLAILAFVCSTDCLARARELSTADDLKRAETKSETGEG
jgi:hypothetical protein